jgi:hypothetical protein
MRVGYAPVRPVTDSDDLPTESIPPPAHDDPPVDAGPVPRPDDD